eukprot:5140712-Pyramimonas_sp.AAC.1
MPKTAQTLRAPRNGEGLLHHAQTPTLPKNSQKRRGPQDTQCRQRHPNITLRLGCRSMSA